jgi:hypothetical protein
MIVLNKLPLFSAVFRPNPVPSLLLEAEAHAPRMRNQVDTTPFGVWPIQGRATVALAWMI